MFARVFRLLPASFRTFAVASAMAFFAFLSVTGASMAIEDPNSDYPVSIEDLCPVMELLFHSEGKWLVEHQPYYEPDDPVMVSHRIQYWNYWHFLETYCGGAPVAH